MGIDLIHKGIMTFPASGLHTPRAFPEVEIDLIRKGIMTEKPSFPSTARWPRVAIALIYKGVMTLSPDGKCIVY